MLFRSWESYPLACDHFFFSTKARKLHYQADFTQGGFLYFGREDRGIDEGILHAHSEQVYKLPMVGGVRSINLATSVGAALYEALRQSQIYTEW